MNKAVKILIEVLLGLVIAGLAWLFIASIQKPVKFNEEVKAREKVGIQRLKDIRTLQVAYKSVNNKFCSTVDSLKDFYLNGNMEVIMQIGSQDDSLAVAHTEAVKKANRKITPAELYQMYLNGDKNLVFAVANKIPVRDRPW